jgi:pSer/pThr/pTyr-binding forkhead associated (FHA) protein
MPRLVLLTEGFTGRSFELKSERSTVGRLEDNTFQIPAPSVSSHHCEILLKDNVVSIKDLDSTNGCYINGEQISEKDLQPGEIVRFGAIEARLEESKGPGKTGKKQLDQTSVLPQGVNLNDLDSGTQRITAMGKGSPFKKKNTKGKAIWIGVAVGVIVVVVAVLAYVFMIAK